MVMGESQRHVESNGTVRFMGHMICYNLNNLKKCEGADMNAKEYGKHVGVSKTKYVLDWIEKGFLPNVKNPETGEIDIPLDMPRPYKSNRKTQKISRLIEEITKAADLQQSVYPQMFPLIGEKTFERTIESMVECQIISRQYSSTGAVYYELLPGWRSCSPAEQKTVFSEIGAPSARELL